MATSFLLVEGWLWPHLLCEVDGSVDHSRCYQDKSWPFETVTAKDERRVIFHKMRSSFQIIPCHLIMHLLCSFLLHHESLQINVLPQLFSQTALAKNNG